jgi:hypothetical protein
MISKILVDILGYVLFISFILCFLGGCIYLIIDSIRKYLEDTDLFYLLEAVLGCIGIMIIAIIILKTFGL